MRGRTLYQPRHRATVDPEIIPGGVPDTEPAVDPVSPGEDPGVDPAPVDPEEPQEPTSRRLHPSGRGQW